MSIPKMESVGEIAAAVRDGDVDPGHFASRALERIAAYESLPNRPNAFLSVVADLEQGGPGARSNPGSADEAAASERPLAGVPVAVKDNLATLDLPTTCGSRILERYTAPYEATVVRRLLDAGAMIVGKTNMDEFAMGSSTENSAFGLARNPHDFERVPGGSSGGSAAAVAAGLVPAALGSDTGGSVRQPAAFCGVVGLKPTYGRVSRYGLVAYASSLEQVGTFGRTVADAAALLEVVAGHDPRDSTSDARVVPELAEAVTRGEECLEGLVVGVPKEYFPPSLDPAIEGLCRATLDALDNAGAVIREVSLPHTQFAIPTYYILAPAEASSNLSRYDGIRFGRRAEASTTLETYESSRSEGFGTEVKRRILLGTYVLSAGYYDTYYGRAQAVRGLIARDFRRVFRDGVDLIFTPTTPGPAFRLGERLDDPYEMYLSDVFTVTANLAGLPAISVPVGMVGGLPVGGQLIASPWKEDVMIRGAAAIEGALGTLDPPGSIMDSSAMPHGSRSGEAEGRSGASGRPAEGGDS